MKKVLLAGCAVACKAGRFLARVLRDILERTQEHASADTFEGSFDWLIGRLPSKNRSKNDENKLEK
jgi:hypothetical protein